jgi:predicted metalloendopeptidase
MFHSLDHNGVEFNHRGEKTGWCSKETRQKIIDYQKHLTAQMQVENQVLNKYGVAPCSNENFCDVCGIALSLQTLLKTENSIRTEKNSLDHLKIFFESLASYWGFDQPSGPYAVHACNRFRTALGPQNIDLFYEIFQIDKSDPSYIPPDQRDLFFKFSLPS